MKKLVIVQNRPTQFDVPLYNLIAKERPFDLIVIYTQTFEKDSGYDPEIGRSPAWDHIHSEDYERVDLDRNQHQNVRQVVELILRSSPDFVLLSGYYPPLHRKLVKPLKKSGLRVGLRSDNSLEHSSFSGLKGIAKRVLLPIWLKRYDAWFPVGSLAKCYLEKVSGVNRSTFLFPYNVDNHWFFQSSQLARANKAELFKEMGFPSDSFVVLGIMKWHQREDPLTLINAFKIFAKDNPNARLILVGDGPMRDQVRGSLEAIAGRVHTPGYVPYSQLPRLYAIADLFVHPSPDEPWGVSVNEALACGVPVVASHGVGARVDLIDEGVTGFVFENGNPGQLATLLKNAMGANSNQGMSSACIEKMSCWEYSQTIREFQRALG